MSRIIYGTQLSLFMGVTIVVIMVSVGTIIGAAAGYLDVYKRQIKALAPNMKIIAPWREWDLKSRTDCMEYAAKHDIPVVATKSHPYSMDRCV